MKYLVVKCNELSDQFECDADRTPICVVDNYADYNKMGYEIYEINADGLLTKIREYDTATDEYFSYCEYDNNSNDWTPKKVVRLKDGDRDAVNKTDIKKWKTQFHFTETINHIMQDIEWSGQYGEKINGKWCVIGETYDESYPTGC